MRTRLFKI